MSIAKGDPNFLVRPTMVKVDDSICPQFFSLKLDRREHSEFIQKIDEGNQY